MTSMMWGCYLGHFDIVKEIISQPEIELNAITINKQNALHFAIAFGSKNKNLLSFLLSFPVCFLFIFNFYFKIFF